MKRRWPWLAAAALAIGGCGQKGPLYLPDKPAKVVTSPAPAGAAPAATHKPNDPDQDPQPQQPPK